MDEPESVGDWTEIETGGRDIKPFGEFDGSSELNGKLCRVLCLSENVYRDNQFRKPFQSGVETS
jgi:hypothetical protein